MALFAAKETLWVLFISREAATIQNVILENIEMCLISLQILKEGKIEESNIGIFIKELTINAIPMIIPHFSMHSNLKHLRCSETQI